MPHSPSSVNTVQRAIYVACNVYVSAGADKGHGSILLHLLRQAQQQAAATSCQVGIVHAYADPVYNRSSFHLVGQAEPLAVVAANLAHNAIYRLREFSAREATTHHEQAQQHDHPFVGLVDHVAIMPVEGIDKHDDNVACDSTTDENSEFTPATPSGIAARHVGKVLQEAGVQVYYYGSAHPAGKSLAQIRREKTKFFQSGGLDTATLSGENAIAQREVATVGAPFGFVENYNIRLRATCPKRVAQSLTKHVRERDGGLTGVEALTLPYSNGRWEVACNLLHPEQTSAVDIGRIVADWEAQVGHEYAEKAYRVGTTAEQCLEAITTFDSARWEQHNAQVQERLQSYLS